MAHTASDMFKKPYLGLNDIELLIDYLLNNRLGLKNMWDVAVENGESEFFIEALCNVISEDGCPLEIVRTTEDGRQMIINISHGFVTNVFNLRTNGI